MKNMFALVMLLSFGFMVTMAVAWPGQDAYPAHGKGYMSYLSEEDQQKVQAIKDEYKPRLSNLHDKMVEQWNQMRSARSNEATTVGQLNAMKIEMFDLKQSFQKTRFMMKMEIQKVTGLKGMGHPHGKYHKYHGYHGYHGYSCGGKKGYNLNRSTNEIES